jgi:hypothetical protein
VMRLLGDYACGRAVDGLALQESMGKLRDAVSAWHLDRSYGVIGDLHESSTLMRDVDMSERRSLSMSRGMSPSRGVSEAIQEAGQAPATTVSDQLIKDTFSFQMEYLYHLIERYIHAIGRPVPFVSNMEPGHESVTSHMVLEEVRASQMKRPDADTYDDVPPTAEATEKSVFEKYGFWRTFVKSIALPTVSLSKERFRYALRTAATTDAITSITRTPALALPRRPCFLCGRWHVSRQCSLTTVAMASSIFAS